MENTIKEYCKQKNKRLDVPVTLEESAFMKAREEAFHDACIAWNYLDKSKKKRIEVPDRPMNVVMHYDLPSKAMSHPDSPTYDENEIDDDALGG